MILSPNRPASVSGTKPAAVAEYAVDPADELRTLAEIHRKKLAKISVWPIDLEAKITPAFRHLFALTPAEEAQLQEAVDGAKRQLQALQFQGAKITKSDKASIVITAGAFDGADIYDELMDSFARTLGDDRFSSFLPIMGEHINRGLDNFGAETRTFTLTRRDGVEKPYSIRDRRQGLPHMGGTVTTSNVSFGGLDSLPERYRVLTPLLSSLHDLAPPPPPPKK